MEQSESLFSAELKSKFKLRSQLPKHVEAGMRMLVITGDVIDMHEKGQMIANMLDLIIPELPADVFLCDNYYSGAVLYPLPMFDNAGSVGYRDAYSIILGSSQWKNPGPGSVIPRLDVLFTKDPVTWAVTAKVVEHTENVR